MRSSSIGRHDFGQARPVGLARGAGCGSDASASRISSRLSPTFWAMRMNETRRSTSRWYRRWLPLERVDRIRPSVS